MRCLLGSAYHRASAASAGLSEFRERLWDSSFRAPFVFSDTTPSSLGSVSRVFSNLTIPPLPHIGIRGGVEIAK